MAIEVRIEFILIKGHEMTGKHRRIPPKRLNGWSRILTRAQAVQTSTSDPVPVSDCLWIVHKKVTAVSRSLAETWIGIMS